MSATNKKQVTSVSLRPELKGRIDRLAKKVGLSRSELIQRTMSLVVKGFRESQDGEITLSKKILLEAMQL